MTTVQRIKETWVQLEQEYTFDSGKRAQRLIEKDSLYRIYIAVDFPSCCRVLLLEFPQEYKGVLKQLKSAQGLKISVEKTGQEQETCTTCAIVSTDPRYNDVFEIVAEDILKKLFSVKSADIYTQIIYQRICKWQEFFMNRSNPQLSQEEIVGLMGELTFVEQLLDAGINDAVNLWNGPARAAQDFQSASFAIEVKSTRSADPKQICISSLPQLDIENREFLHLILYKFETVQTGGYTLSEMIKLVKGKVPIETQDRFDENIMALGYLEQHSERYAERFVLRSTAAFNVVDGFPKITRNDLQPGIVEVAYWINVQSIQPFRIDMIDVISRVRGENDG